MFWNLGGTGTAGKMAADVNGKLEVLLQWIWMSVLPQETCCLFPLQSHNQAAWAFSYHLFALALLLFSWPRPPLLFICPAGCATNDPHTPTCFVPLIFPVPRTWGGRQSKVTWERVWEQRSGRGILLDILNLKLWKCLELPELEGRAEVVRVVFLTWDSTNEWHK